MKIPERLVFLDVETTGLNGTTDRIIEIFMLAVAKNGDVDEYHSLINPSRALPQIITEITGLTDADLVGAPTEAEIAGEIREFIGLGSIVAHNLSFDQRFLNAMFRRNNLLEVAAAGIDTLKISRELFPKLCIYPQGGGSHRLSNLMCHFNLQDAYANSHRAKDDVMLLIEVFRNLQAYANGEGVTYPDPVINGCPLCGMAMYLEEVNGETVLLCKKNSSCQNKLIV